MSTDINMCTVCIPEGENAGSHSKAVLLWKDFQPSKCRATIIDYIYIYIFAPF